MKSVYLIALLAIIPLAGFAHAAEPAPVEKTGLKVGDTAPEFKLKDQSGQEHSLKELTPKEGYVALVFYRSASW